MLAFWTESWWHAGRSPSSLARRTQYPWFPSRMSNFDSSYHRTFFHFETVQSLAHRTQQRFWTMFTYGFLFCMIELWLASADGMEDCVYRQWFLEVFLGPFCNVNDRIMPMRDAELSEGPKTTGIQQRSLALSLMHRDFSSFSESFDDAYVDKEICKAFAIWLWGTLFLKYSTIFVCTFLKIGEPLPIFTSERLPL